MAAQNLLLFFRALACNPRSVGAIAPSGANLASLITSEITAASGPVLELGPGTGVFTEALLERGVRESALTLIEYGSDFMRLLQARFPRARVLWMDAAWMASHDLFEHPLGAVVSGLPLLNFAPKKVAAISPPPSASCATVARSISSPMACSARCRRRNSTNSD